MDPFRPEALNVRLKLDINKNVTVDILRQIKAAIPHSVIGPADLERCGDFCQLWDQLMRYFPAVLLPCAPRDAEGVNVVLDDTQSHPGLHAMSPRVTLSIRNNTQGDIVCSQLRCRPIQKHLESRSAVIGFNKYDFLRTTFEEIQFGMGIEIINSHERLSSRATNPQNVNICIGDGQQFLFDEDLILCLIDDLAHLMNKPETRRRRITEQVSFANAAAKIYDPQKKLVLQLRKDEVRIPDGALDGNTIAYAYYTVNENQTQPLSQMVCEERSDSGEVFYSVPIVLGPEGVTFNEKKPAKIKLTHFAFGSDDTLSRLRIRTKQGNGIWTSVEERDCEFFSDLHMIILETSHFSKFFVGLAPETPIESAPPIQVSLLYGVVEGKGTEEKEINFMIIPSSEFYHKIIASSPLAQELGFDLTDTHDLSLQVETDLDITISYNDENIDSRRMKPSTPEEGEEDQRRPQQAEETEVTRPTDDPKYHHVHLNVDQQHKDFKLTELKGPKGLKHEDETQLKPFDAFDFAGLKQQLCKVLKLEDETQLKAFGIDLPGLRQQRKVEDETTLKEQPAGFRQQDKGRHLIGLRQQLKDKLKGPKSLKHEDETQLKPFCFEDFDFAGLEQQLCKGLKLEDETQLKAFGIDLPALRQQRKVEDETTLKEQFAGFRQQDKGLDLIGSRQQHKGFNTEAQLAEQMNRHCRDFEMVLLESRMRHFGLSYKLHKEPHLIERCCDNLVDLLELMRLTYSLEVTGKIDLVSLQQFFMDHVAQLLQDIKRYCDDLEEEVHVMSIDEREYWKFWLHVTGYYFGKVNRLREEWLEVASEVDPYVSSEQVVSDMSESSKGEDTTLEELVESQSRLTFSRKDVDTITDLLGAFDLCEQNDIDVVDLDNVEEMKTLLITRLEGEESEINRARLIEKFKEAADVDLQIRCQLLHVYDEVNVFFKLDQCTEDIVNLIDHFVPDCCREVQCNHDQLRGAGCPILVAGDSGAGKSSFLNLITRNELLPVDHTLSASSSICEIHNSNKPEAIIKFGPDHDSYTKQGTNAKTIELNKDNPKGAQKILEGYSFITERKLRDKNIFDLIQINWPIPMLQGDAFLVDTPGLGESTRMTNKVLRYLPKASAFIYVIDTSASGGLSEQRLEDILKKLTSVRGEEKLQQFNPKSAIFIFNKWEQVPEKKREQVRKRNVARLKKWWPGLDENKQIYNLSVTQAQKRLDMKAGETPELKRLLDELCEFMEKGMRIRIENHQRWLSFLTGRLLNIIKAKVTGARRSKHENRRIRASIDKNLKQLLESSEKTLADLEEKVGNEEGRLAAELLRHLEDEQTIAQLAEECVMMDIEISEDMSENEKMFAQHITDAIIKEIDHWESVKQPIKTAKEKLENEFKTEFRQFSEKLQEIEGKMQTIPGGLESAMLFGKSPTEEGKLSLMEKIVIGMTAVVWVPLAVTSLILALPILAPMAVYDSIINKGMLRKYREDKRPFLKMWIKEAVGKFTEEELKRSFINYELSLVGEKIREFKKMVPQLVLADRELMDRVESDQRKQTDIEDQNVPLLKQLMASFGKLQYTKLRYLLFNEPDVYRKESLDWDDLSGELGEGTFSAVTIASVTLQGEDKPTKVAAKKMKKRLSPDCAVSFAQEREILRSLNHPNIVKYQGTVVDEKDNFILLLELCKCSLAKEIFTKSELNPGKQGDPKRFREAFKYAVDVIRQISLGLAFLHSKSYVHRDLKTANVLVTDNGTIKLSDLGQAKVERDITGTRRGTHFYLDPAVLQGGLATKEADMFSVGIIMAEVWFGFLAFHDKLRENPQVEKQQIQEKINSGLRPSLKIDGYCSPLKEWCKVMEDCWNEEPKARIESEAVQEEMRKMLQPDFVQERVEEHVSLGEVDDSKWLAMDGEWEGSYLDLL